MIDHTSYDENGPLISLGNVAFSADTGLPGGRQVFELPTYLVASEESQVIVEYQGFRLTDFGTWNDYYGFGSSAETALVEAKAAIDRLTGCNCDLLVKTTLKTRPCFPSDNKPFYNGAQRVHYIPLNWRCENDAIKKAEQEFIVLRNGEHTAETAQFLSRIKELVDQDSAPARNGDLRSIFTRKKPTSSADFLRAIDAT